MAPIDAGAGLAGQAEAAPRAVPDHHVLRRVGIGLAGFGVLLLGVGLLAVPIPGTTVIVIPLGLTILAREFSWAVRVRGWSTERLSRLWSRLRRLSGARALDPGRSAPAVIPRWGTLVAAVTVIFPRLARR